MGQALYRKYRSKSLAELVGQEHVTTTLANALKAGRISHAYLLSGPRGVGKTSIARILAHEINGLPYNDEAHLDIIEIDAASNRRIDEIRDIRDRVHTAPAQAKYKVYIIDEVHMLTKEAFNALLKTLEEPPAHVVFILATTEAHKLPETIISRTQRYSLRPVPQDKVVAHLHEIAKGEKLKIDDDALELIAQHGEGSFRDSISLLDQASGIAEHVTRANVASILGLAPEEYIARLSAAVVAGDNSAIVITLSELYALGFEPAMISHQLSAQLRQTVLDGTTNSPQATLQLLQKLLDVPASRNPRQLLELVLLQAALPSQSPAASVVASAPQQVAAVATKPANPTPLSAPAAPQPRVQPAPLQPPSKDEKPAPKEPAAVDEQPTVKVNPPEVPQTDASEQTPATTTPPETIDVTELWHQVLEDIKGQYNTLYGIARMAQPTFDGSQLTLAFKFGFHQKRLNEVKNRQIFADAAARRYGSPIEITCVVAEPEESSAKPDVAAISNIFGGAELLP